MKISYIYSRLFFLVLTAICTLPFTSYGQDPHFSQFYASPLNLNPALAGTAAGNYRVSVNYRDQWRGALDNPLKTFGASGDLKHMMNDRQNRPDILAGGFMFFSDQVSDFDLNTNQIALVGAYHKSLSQNYDNYIGIGVQFGLNQKSINYEDLFFQDQFNAIDGFDLQTGELLPANNFAFLDFVVGLNYSTAPRKGVKYYGGVSFAHLSSPNISFYRSDESPNPDLIKENKLHRKLSAYVGASLQTTQALEVQPRALLLLQGPHMEVNLGTNFRHKITERGGTYLHFGPWLRLSRDEESVGVESLVFSVGYEIENFMLGISYDHSVSDLVNDRKGLNALEISISYLGEVDNNDGFCPTF
jgi:type IX secretion system PorP/SprF family membrane protein